MKIIGVQSYSFHDQSGVLVEGNKIHCLDDSVNKNLVGNACVSFNFSNPKLSMYLSGRTIQQVIGKPVELVYNKYGKVDVINDIK